MVKIYTVKAERLDDTERINRQLCCAVIRFIRQVRAKDMCIPEIEVSLTDQYRDSFIQNKVAIILTATVPKNKVTIISEEQC